MKFREHLVKVLESIDSSKEIICNNQVNSFDDMGMAKVEPGEFSKGEITNPQNLVNVAKMSNDNDFVDEDSDFMDDIEDLVSDFLDISVKDDADMENTEVEVEKKPNGKEYKITKIFESVFARFESANDCFIRRAPSGEYYVYDDHGEIQCVCDTEEEAEEALANMVKKQECAMTESQYAAPLDYVPDMRFNVSDVLDALKREIGDGSEALHVDQVSDSEGNKTFVVSMIDKEKLPKTIQVEKVILKLDGDTYSFDKVADSYPVAK